MRGADNQITTLMDTSKPRTRTRLFVGLVALAGAAAIGASARHLLTNPFTPDWVILAGLTLLGALFTVRIAPIPATISISETFIFLIIALFGIAPAVLTVALEGLLVSLWRHWRTPHRVIFNATEAPFSLWLASSAFLAITGHNPGSAEMGRLFLGLAALAASYFLLNSSLMAVAVSLETGASPLSIWSNHFLWLSIDYFVGASLTGLLVLASATASFATIAIVLPILVICYLAFRFAAERVIDANRHLKDLNDLYLSVIEALARTVDAKDHSTHGHVRRVQMYATSLARRLGLRDESLLKAIEAAALLHDMGKLAIPETILNKPGALTHAEFETIKGHVSVGARILASVKFPYPVVPIVRHHHEHWDGSGYPDGLAGSDIPIGARILAVVDAYDALTSDRPYRRKLPRRAALEVLRRRSGRNYDPHVVETFVRWQLDEIGGLAPDRGASDDPTRACLRDSRGEAHRTAPHGSPPPRATAVAAPFSVVGGIRTSS